MSFLEFLSYFLLSEIILQGLIVGAILLKRKYQANRIKKLIANGQIKILTQDEITRLMSEHEKKSWN